MADSDLLLITDIEVEWPSESVSYQLQPAILSTCRKIYQEAGPILYRENRFTFTHPSDCNIFVHLMDRTHSKLIRCVLLRMRDRDTRLWADWMTSTDPVRCFSNDLPNLERLRVFLRHGSFWQHDRPIDDQFRTWHRNKRLEHSKLPVNDPRWTLSDTAASKCAWSSKTIAGQRGLF